MKRVSTTRLRSRILLAAEDAIICRLISRGLAGEHDVVDVGAGADALNLLARGERFDVVVFDTNLEDGLDGAAFYDRLCASRA